MQRIPPSEKIRQTIRDVLQNGLETGEDVTSLVIRLGMERLIQEMLEEEVKDYRDVSATNGRMQIKNIEATTTATSQAAYERARERSRCKYARYGRRPRPIVPTSWP